MLADSIMNSKKIIMPELQEETMFGHKNLSSPTSALGLAALACLFFFRPAVRTAQPPKGSPQRCYSSTSHGKLAMDCG